MLHALDVGGGGSSYFTSDVVVSFAPRWDLEEQRTLHSHSHLEMSFMRLSVVSYGWFSYSRNGQFGTRFQTRQKTRL